MERSADPIEATGKINDFLMAKGNTMQDYYVTDGLHKHKVTANNSSDAAAMFAQKIIEQSRQALKEIESGNIDPLSPENEGKYFFNLGEYIYVSTQGFYENDKEMSQCFIFISVNILKSIGENQIAEIMNKQINEIESLKKLKGTIDKTQMNYLEDHIDNLEKEKEINRLLE